MGAFLRLIAQVTELCTGGELFDRIIAKTESAEGHYSERDAANIVHKILGYEKNNDKIFTTTQRTVRYRKNGLDGHPV